MLRPSAPQRADAHAGQSDVSGAGTALSNGMARPAFARPCPRTHEGLIADRIGPATAPRANVTRPYPARAPDTLKRRASSLPWRNGGFRATALRSCTPVRATANTQLLRSPRQPHREPASTAVHCGGSWHRRNGTARPRPSARPHIMPGSLVLGFDWSRRAAYSRHSRG